MTENQKFIKKSIAKQIWARAFDKQSATERAYNAFLSGHNITTKKISGAGNIIWVDAHQQSAIIDEQLGITEWVAQL